MYFLLKGTFIADTLVNGAGRPLRARKMQRHVETMYYYYIDDYFLVDMELRS